MKKEYIMAIIIWAVLITLFVVSFLTLMIASAKEEKRRKLEKEKRNDKHNAKQK